MGRLWLLTAAASCIDGGGPTLDLTQGSPWPIVDRVAMPGTTKKQVPAVEGLFTVDEPPHLIGGRLIETGGYCFPKDLGGADPGASGGAVEEVLLSHRGKIWSFRHVQRDSFSNYHRSYV